MFIWLKILSKFIKALRSGDSPGQIAIGFSLGFFIGLMPLLTIQTFFLFLVLVLLNVNFAAGMVAMFLANLFAYLLDPVLHSVGFYILTEIASIRNFWESLYNVPFAPLSRFNNTIVMGSFIGGLVSFFPVYLGMKRLVVAYRSGLEERIKKWKIVQVITGSKIVKFYLKIRNL